MPDKVTLDARNLLCPMPVIRLQTVAADLAPGVLVEVRATDPGTKSDIPAWCRIHGHRVVEVVERGGELLLSIEIGGGAQPPGPSR